jgi:hypothetical protein
MVDGLLEGGLMMMPAMMYYLAILYGGEEGL